MIKLTGLSKAYHGNQVLNGIYLEVKKGEIVVIIGPSGTGKSTLLCCLNLLETTDAGTLTIDDLALNLAKATTPEAIELCKRTSFVFQNYALFANKTALDNIAEGLAPSGNSQKPRPVPLRWASSRTLALPTSRMPIRPPLRRPAAAGRHWPRHGGPLQDDPV